MCLMHLYLCHDSDGIVRALYEKRFGCFYVSVGTSFMTAPIYSNGCRKYHNHVSRTTVALSWLCRTRITPAHRELFLLPKTRFHRQCHLLISFDFISIFILIYQFIYLFNLLIYSFICLFFTGTFLLVSLPGLIFPRSAS